MIPKLLNEEEAAERLNVEPATLSKWRCTRRYALPYVKVGRRVLYREDDLAAYIEANTVHPACPKAGT